VLISAEPTARTLDEPNVQSVAHLIGLIEEGRHQIYVHPASLAELDRDGDEERRRMRRALLKKYLTLEAPPPIPPEFEAIFRRVDDGTPGSADSALLASVAGDAVDFLVTEDQRLLKRARRAGFEARVVTAAEAAAAIEGLFRFFPHPPPAVERLPCHALASNDSFFDSLRRDYPEFDEWMAKCRREHRSAWVIHDEGDKIAGLCIVKDAKSLRGGHLRMKICTFKIDERYRGLRYGELLLKAVFDYAGKNKFTSAYVTVFPRHEELRALFEAFGFENQETRTTRGEVVMIKRLQYSAEEYESIEALEFNVRFGPRALSLRGVGLFVVPVLPGFHARLFPEAENQGDLFPGRYPFGNGIRKAYVCNSPTQRLVPGSVLLFYRSREARGITCAGVVEQVLRGRDPDRIASFVGTRTVFSYEEIEAISQRSALAVLFRQARVFHPPWRPKELVERAVLAAAPRSITEVSKEGQDWIRHRLIP
jgi:L-amino acid N-acyltransferase YncA